VLVVLLGFALFGALFAAANYQPQEVERELPTPRFRLGPGEMRPDFIEPGARDESISVNMTVVRGGPIDAYVMNMENLTLNALNETAYQFELGENVSYDPGLSRTNITSKYNFTFEHDGENQTVLLIGSRMKPDPNRTREENVTAVSVRMTYNETQRASVFIGGLLSSPSLILVAVVAYRRYRRGHPPREAAGKGSRESAHWRETGDPPPDP